MIESKIVRGPDARKAIENATRFAVDIVANTLGPAGRNAILDRGRDDRSPLITNDGKSIAQELSLPDECENLALRNFIEAALRADDEAGDGTTTAITIGGKIVEDAFEEIGDHDETGVPGQRNPMDVSRQIDRETKEAVELLKGMVTEVDSLEALGNVAFTSLEDRELGDIVAKARHEVGKEGFVTIEEGYNQIIEMEVVSGLKVMAKYAADFMITNDKGQAVFKNVPVLVTNATFSTIGGLSNLFASIQKEDPNKGNAIVIMGSKFEAEAIRQVANIYHKTQDKMGYKILLVKVPSLTDDELEDVASFLDANFINTDPKVGMALSNARFKDLGHCSKFIVDNSDAVMIGGRGLTAQVFTKPEKKEKVKGVAKTKDEDPIVLTRVEKRKKDLKDKIGQEKDTFFKKKMERRLGVLSGGVGVIKVGAKSDTEKSYLKLKVEDAINAVKVAYQEGVVPGGGIALRNVADLLEKEHGKGEVLIAGALREPYERIQRNAGESFEIPSHVIDPFKVTRSALVNAASVARILITTGTIRADKRPSLVEDLQEILPEHPIDRNSRNM